MSEPRKKLTEEDVAKLLSDPSATTRAETAAKVASDFGGSELTPAERKIAEDILRLMIKDAEVRVRQALSENLKENPGVPHDVAVALAKDVDAVALPMLQFSAALSDDDLIEIVRSQTPAKQVAIARRPKVSERVSGALVETHNEQVVTTLVANQGADISEKALETVVQDFGKVEAVQAAIVRRPKLPITIAERLVTMVSEHLKGELAKRADLPPNMATDLILQSRERATIGLSSGSSEDELEQLVLQLRDNGRLTPSIILRALCMGDLRFFEMCLAVLAGVPLTNTRKLIHDSGPLGLKAVFDKAGLPAGHFPAVKAAIAVARETDYDGGDNDRARYSRRMIERILTQYGDLGVDFDSDDLEYLLAKMNELPADKLDYGRLNGTS